MLSRRLKWLAVIANMPGLVGSLHRFLATTPGPSSREPSAALAAALAEAKWKVVRNLASSQGRRWPLVDPEPSFDGDIFLEPREEVAPQDTVWTDGSLGDSGGAAAFQADSDLSLKCHVPFPRSSTQCELVALTLVAHFLRQPPLVLTDSLCTLQLLRSWGFRSTSKVLCCPERAEVRPFLAMG